MHSKLSLRAEKRTHPLMYGTAQRDNKKHRYYERAHALTSPFKDFWNPPNHPGQRTGPDMMERTIAIQKYQVMGQFPLILLFQQRSAIKQCSIARILCDNTKIAHITRKPFLRPSYNNPDISCKEIPKIDLTPWKECVSEADIPTGCLL
ncbi:hypothetical protein AVEN_241541-1 [Araneus ventricosus]|uniref:Uncharacterized protein n=1 Tax=Araneus ventricosus TaxID=182803 RepID=A0A4Y2S2H2_ARAVE|nr:hypothetical protein AVEN_241541-1 [Araneus ventricosus]